MGMEGWNARDCVMGGVVVLVLCLFSCDERETPQEEETGTSHHGVMPFSICYLGMRMTKNKADC